MCKRSGLRSSEQVLHSEESCLQTPCSRPLPGPCTIVVHLWDHPRIPGSGAARARREDSSPWEPASSLCAPPRRLAAVARDAPSEGASFYSRSDLQTHLAQLSSVSILVQRLQLLLSCAEISIN